MTILLIAVWCYLLMLAEFINFWLIQKSLRKILQAVTPAPDASLEELSKRIVMEVFEATNATVEYLELTEAAADRVRAMLQAEFKKGDTPTA